MGKMINVEVEKPDLSRMLRDICFAKDFRRMQDKTQMFNTRITEHFRTRLTHTIEVATISEEILGLLKKCFKDLNKEFSFTFHIEPELLKAIAYAHDIGHTPYGHAGEEIINELVSKNSNYFKHNVNAAKVLLDTKVIAAIDNKDFFNFNFQSYDWSLFDGVIKHTSPIPKQDSKASMNQLDDPYNLKQYFQNHSVLSSLEFENELSEMLRQFPNEAFVLPKEKFIDDSFINLYINYKFPLTLEGQIVAIADEISQRISDFDDSIRLYHKWDDNPSFKVKYSHIFEELAENLGYLGKQYEENEKNCEEKSRKHSINNRLKM